MNPVYFAIMILAATVVSAFFLLLDQAFSAKSKSGTISAAVGATAFLFGGSWAVIVVGQAVAS